MSESIETVRVGDPLAAPLASDVLAAPLAPGVPAPLGAPDAALTGASVRELLTELAGLEDAARGPSCSVGPTGPTLSTDLVAALAREQEIIDELHARCPDAEPAGSCEAGGPDPLG